MRILQVDSQIHKKRIGQWFCSDTEMGSDGDPVNRYLQPDGSWKKNTHYFDSKEDVEKALAIGIKPDFSLSDNEKCWRFELKQSHLEWEDELWENELN